jgi:phage/plasmid-like protein (TIGR03299 family)
MSKETSQWLNNYCLIGLTDKRGHAWHYRESDQGVEPNHYSSFIPIEDVVRRLFNFTIESRPVYVQDASGAFVEVPGKRAQVASDNSDVLGIFSKSYQGHQYEEWLLNNVASILSTSRNELGIGSALLLRNRGVAVVQVEVPESFTTPDGVEYRPNLLCATSFDGSLATIYKRTITVAVCDNTTEAGLRESGQQYKVKHTLNSTVKLGEARDALQVIFESGDAFADEVSRLCATTVTEQQWNKVLDALVPLPDEDGRALTYATNKRDALWDLWRKDDRVEPWRNTAWGVAQAFNTYDQHLSIVRGAHRAERNFDNVLTGKVAKGDQGVLSALSSVLDKQLVLA